MTSILRAIIENHGGSETHISSRRQIFILKLIPLIEADVLREHSFNRNVEKTQVDKIKTKIDYSLIGLLRIAKMKVKNEDDREREDLYILDGQHRYRALKEIHTNSSSIPLKSDIILEVIPISDGDEFIRTLRIANDIEKMKEETISDIEKYNKLKKLMEVKYKSTFEIRGKGKVFGENRPRLLDSKFKKIKEKKFFIENSEEEILEILDIINEKYYEEIKNSHDSSAKKYLEGGILFSLGFKKEYDWLDEYE